jgi:D-glycero-alpha-D-manno-heptose-7-phosphate kinase
MGNEAQHFHADQHFDDRRALCAGACRRRIGGKLAGAGGGGFLLLYCPKPAQAQVRESLNSLQSLEFRFGWGGARIAFAQ